MKYVLLHGITGSAVIDGGEHTTQDAAEARAIKLRKPYSIDIVEVDGDKRKSISYVAAGEIFPLD